MNFTLPIFQILAQFILGFWIGHGSPSPMGRLFCHIEWATLKIVPFTYTRTKLYVYCKVHKKHNNMYSTQCFSS